MSQSRQIIALLESLVTPKSNKRVQENKNQRKVVRKGKNESINGELVTSIQMKMMACGYLDTMCEYVDPAEIDNEGDQEASEVFYKGNLAPQAEKVARQDCTKLLQLLMDSPDIILRPEECDWYKLGGLFFMVRNETGAYFPDSEIETYIDTDSFSQLVNSNFRGVVPYITAQNTVDIAEV